MPVDNRFVGSGSAIVSSALGPSWAVRTSFPLSRNSAPSASAPAGGEAAQSGSVQKSSQIVCQLDGRSPYFAAVSGSTTASGKSTPAALSFPLAQHLLVSPARITVSPLPR